MPQCGIMCRGSTRSDGQVPPGETMRRIGRVSTGQPGRDGRGSLGRSASALAAVVKTRYLYSMASRLVNVRLDEERLRKARALRKKGITLSDLVRTAIDERYQQAISSRGPRDMREILARLDSEYPLTAKDFPPLQYDVHDRHQAAAAIRKRLGRKRLIRKCGRRRGR
jgi:hypothetical protein